MITGKLITYNNNNNLISGYVANQFSGLTSNNWENWDLMVTYLHHIICSKDVVEYIYIYEYSGM